jgi:putative MATE family efflux protein
LVKASALLPRDLPSSDWEIYHNLLIVATAWQCYPEPSKSIVDSAFFSPEYRSMEIPVASPPDKTEGTAVVTMSRARVFGLALPIIGEQMLHTVVVAVDTFLVARLGKEAVAGVGIAVEFIYFIIAILIALEIGATVLISQAFGAGDSARVVKLARQAFAWGVALAIPVTIAGILAAPSIVALFGLEPEVADHANTYLRITAATSIFLLLTFIGGSIFRGRGDSRTPLYAAIVANVVNVFASYGLIFGKFGLPELGVAGSAWGAAIARACSAAILIGLLFLGTRGISLRGWGDWVPAIDVGKSLFRLGLPASFEQIIASAGFVTMVAVVATIGTPALAAQQIAFTALAIAFMPGFGFGLAATALIGQSVGAKRLDHAGEASRIAERWAIIWMSIGGLAYFGLAPQIMRIFTDEIAVIDAGVDALRALAIGLPIWAVWSVYGGSLRGIGDTVTPMITNGGTVWAAVLIAFIWVSFFNGGIGAVWLTFFITAPFGAAFNRHRYWKRINSGRVGPVGALSGH